MPNGDAPQPKLWHWPATLVTLLIILVGIVVYLVTTSNMAAQNQYEIRELKTIHAADMQRLDVKLDEMVKGQTRQGRLLERVAAQMGVNVAE